MPHSSPTASAAKPEKADFLAQTDNQGGGSAERAQRPLDDQLSQLPQTDPGHPRFDRRYAGVAL